MAVDSRERRVSQNDGEEGKKRGHASGSAPDAPQKKKSGRGVGVTLLLALLIVVALGSVVFLLKDELPILWGEKDRRIKTAEEQAARYDFDSALATLQTSDAFSSDTQMQQMAAVYEAQKLLMDQDVNDCLEAARQKIMDFDYQGAIDLLEASTYFSHSVLLQNRARECQTALDAGGEADPENVAQAETLAAMYDYDGAIALLKDIQFAEENPGVQARVADYEAKRAACVPMGPDEVTHVFYHSLVVDPAQAFDPEKEGYAGWQQWMTTISEFDKITQSMYDRGYVLVSIHDLFLEVPQEDGTVNIAPHEVYLPEGKKPYVLSLDDLSYYHTYDGHGVASKIVLDEEGKPTCEYVAADGSVSYGDYDAVPRLDAFLEEHPDGCYRGARGIVALTGYNGILGYRTDGAYSEAHNTDPDKYFPDADQLEWLANHPDFDWEAECASAKAVADAMKAEGWEFASHTWGHKGVGDTDYEKLVADNERWMQYVSPLIGETDTIIFAHGQDLSPTGAYDESNEKYNYFKSQGFRAFCNVDSRAYTASVTASYFHQGRRNLDGYRIYQDAYNDQGMTSDLFDAAEVIDPERPLPVPDLGMDGGEGGTGDYGEDDEDSEETYEEDSYGDGYADEESYDG